MKLVAIDFETANTSPVSAISLGISTFIDGEFLDNEVIYILPPSGYTNFMFTYIHHLTYNDVKDAPPFDRYYNMLKDRFEGAVLVAHNARFDLGVLNACCDYYGLPHFKNRYLDTVMISRIVYPYLENHRLNTVSAYLGIDLDHHEAGSDSFACLSILVSAMEDSGTYDIDEFLNKIHMKLSSNR